MDSSVSTSSELTTSGIQRVVLKREGGKRNRRNGQFQSELSQEEEQEDTSRPSGQHPEHAPSTSHPPDRAHPRKPTPGPDDKSEDESESPPPDKKRHVDYTA